MRLLRQSTAFTFRIGPFLDSADGVTPETSLSIGQGDIQISKDGGAFAQTSAASPTTTHDADGWYQCPLTTTDTATLGPITIQINMSGALPVWEHFLVVTANVYDALVDGSDYLQTDIAQILGVATNLANLNTVLANYSATRGFAGTALPAVTAGSNGGLPTVDASNHVAGVQGTINDFDGLENLSSADVQSSCDAAITANTDINNIDTGVNNIEAKLPTGDIADQTLLNTVDGNVDSVLEDTGTTIPAQISSLENLSSADVQSACDTAISANTDINNIDTGVNNIEAKLPTGDIADQTLLGTVDGKIDTLDGNVDSVLEDTGTTIPNQISGLENVSAADVQSACDSAITANTDINSIDTGVNNIEAKLPAGDIADQTLLNTVDGKIDTVDGKIDTLDGNVDSVLEDTGTTIPTQISGLENISASEVNAQVDQAIEDYRLDELMVTALGSQPATGSVLGDLTEDDGSGTQQFTTGALANAPTGSGGISEIIDTEFLIPATIDLADTTNFRIGMRVVNAVDDLPTTAEITPGTISIDRKAIGATSWTNILTDAACSEASGYIYYDEVFDSTTGYAEGDSLRFTFKSQSVTASGNTFEITGSGGVIVYSEIRQTMRGTDSAATVGAQMNLADDAITAAKYDQSTAHPIESADSGSTEIARAGADGDTLETISDEIAGLENVSAADVQTACDTAISANTDINNIDTGVNNIEAKLPSKTYLTGTDNPTGYNNIDALDSSLKKEADSSSALSSGSTVSGSYADTFDPDGNYWIVTNNGSGNLNVALVFLLGEYNKPVSMKFKGYLTGANDSVNMDVWNWSTSSWDNIAVITGADDIETRTVVTSLRENHMSTTPATYGRLAIRFNGSGLTSANLGINQLYVGYVKDLDNTISNNSVITDIDTKTDGIAGLSTFDPDSDAVNVGAIGGSTTIDGVSLVTAFKRMFIKLIRPFTGNATAYTKQYQDENGDTEFTHTTNSTTGSRSLS